MEQKDEPGKVQLKTILKGNATQNIRPAAASGFKVADFQMTTAKDSVEDYLKNEIAALQSKIATLNGEIANKQKKAEQEAKAAYEKGVQDGKVTGFVEGEQKALEQSKELLKNLQDETTKTLEGLAQQQKENFEKIENASAEIAIAIAKRVFCEEATQNPNIIARIMKEAFTFLGQEEKIKIRINPLDLTFAEQTESFWKPTMTSLKDIEFIFDNSIERGGCILESETGSAVDIRIETVFKHINEFLVT
ncbi:MAG: hypothetical protein LBC85_07370 [Fibromonadaceae bacterium]|jgi:flagellar assembly protein FliH|nr:hypothetical protein [Fibromonadaceae bacterium]